MNRELKSLLAKHKLHSHAAVIESFLSPTVGFSLSRFETQPKKGISRVGGCPELPRDFAWPENNGRPLDYLLQVNLSDLASSVPNSIPTSGLLTFFYDMENQPWGFDPNDLDGFRVIHLQDVASLQRVDEVPEEEFEFPDSRMKFYNFDSLPQYGSAACDRLLGQMPLEDDQEDSYFDFIDEYRKLFSDDLTSHQFFGHSANMQGDMQLEAQLVTNGLYCGDASGYNDPRAAGLAETADEWQLLLQLDSDDRVAMWGDAGMLYYWIRRKDLVAGDFTRVWMTLQCG